MSDTASATNQPKLQWVNIANLVAYIINCLVTYGVGASDTFSSNSDISAKYQTLVTPAGYAFSIWGIIFIAQLVWAIFQMLPAYRSNELVVHGVGFYYVAVCIAQVAWTIFFTLEKIGLSLLAMVCILLPLLKILTTTSKMSHDSLGQYWLLKFPFEIHAAWIMAATLVNFNVVLVAINASPATQVAFGWISLLALAVAAVHYTLTRKFVVPFVLAWASFAIAVELGSPKELIANAFSEESIQLIMKGSGVLAVGVVCFILSTYVYDKTTPEVDEPEAYTAVEN